MRRLALVLAILAASTVACARGGDVLVPSSSCENVPGSVCTDQVQAAANTVGGAVKDVVVVCTAPACTRAGGSGTATVIRPDGTQVTLPWRYLGDPGPQPVPACIGLAAGVCQAELNSVIGDVPIEKRIVRITVTCTDDRCDEAAGHIRIDYGFSDGSKDSVSSGWEGP